MCRCCCTWRSSAFGGYATRPLDCYHVSHLNQDRWIVNGRKLTALMYTPHRTRRCWWPNAEQRCVWSLLVRVHCAKSSTGHVRWVLIGRASIWSVHCMTTRLRIALTSPRPDADALRPVACVRWTAKVHWTRQCTTASVRSLSPFARASIWIDQMRRCPRGQHPVCFFSEEHFWKITESHLYRSNSTSFTNVLTPPSVHRHVHVC
jgi:hypothetical protein